MIILYIIRRGIMLTIDTLQWCRREEMGKASPAAADPDKAPKATTFALRPATFTCRSVRGGVCLPSSFSVRVATEVRHRFAARVLSRRRRVPLKFEINILYPAQLSRSRILCTTIVIIC